MSEYLIGMDIGSTKICASAGKIDKQGKLQIMGITSVNCVGMKKGVVINIDGVTDSIKKCISKLEGMIDEKISEIALSISTEICELVSNKGVVAIASEDREIVENDIERVKKAAKTINLPLDREVIDIIPEQFIVDGYEDIKDPRGMSGARLELDAQIVISQTTILNNIFKCVNKAGLKVIEVFYQPLAILEAVTKNEDRDLGVVLVDSGAENSRISIYKKGILKYTDSINIGGNNITNDISVCLKISLKEAEKLKTKYFSAGKGMLESSAKISINSGTECESQVEYRLLLDIMEARIEEILHLVKSKVIGSGLYKEVSEVILVGGAMSSYKDIEKLSKEIIQKPVKVGTTEFIGAASPLYVTSVGVVKSLFNNYKDKDLQNEKLESKADSKADSNSRVWGKSKNEVPMDENSIISKIKGFFTEFF